MIELLPICILMFYFLLKICVFFLSKKLFLKLDSHNYKKILFVNWMLIKMTPFSVLYNFDMVFWINHLYDIADKENQRIRLLDYFELKYNYILTHKNARKTLISYYNILEANNQPTEQVVCQMDEYFSQCKVQSFDYCRYLYIVGRKNEILDVSTKSIGIRCLQYRVMLEENCFKSWPVENLSTNYPIYILLHAILTLKCSDVTIGKASIKEFISNEKKAKVDYCIRVVELDGAIEELRQILEEINYEKISLA